MTSQKELKKLRANLRTWFKRASEDELNQGLVWYKEAMWFANELANMIVEVSHNDRQDRNDTGRQERKHLGHRLLGFWPEVTDMASELATWVVENRTLQGIPGRTLLSTLHKDDRASRIRSETVWKEMVRLEVRTEKVVANSGDAVVVGEMS